MSQNSGKLSFGTKAFFGSGETVSVMTGTVIGLYFMYFLTNVVGIAPAIAGTIFMVGRLWDAIFDPIVGMISDRTRTRWGRRRPFFIITAVPISVLYFFLWFPIETDNQWLQIIYYTIVYVFFMTSLAAFYIPYLSLMAEMTDDYHERTSVNNYRIFYQLFFGLVAATVPKMIADHYINNYDNPSLGYMMLGLSIAAFVFLIPFILFKTTKERPVKKVNAHKENYVKEFFTVYKNNTFRYLLLIYVGCYAASNVVEGFVIYYMADWLNRESDMPILFVIVVGFGILSLPLWSKISIKLGKKQALVIGLAVWAISQLTFFFITPAAPDYIVYVVGAIVGVGYGVAHVLPWSMLPDVLDEDELKTGQKREGLYAGVMNLLMKVINSLAMFLIGIILQVAGYAAKTPLGDGTLQTIRITMAVAPTIFVVIGLVAAILYPLTREHHIKVRAELAKRQAEM